MLTVEQGQRVFDAPSGKRSNLRLRARRVTHLTPREKMRLFAWWLHVHGGKENFLPGDIKDCYDKLHLSQINIAMNLNRMADAKPPDLLCEGKAFKLGRGVRSELDKKYGVHQSIQAVSKLLADLPAKVPGADEKVFLSEALDCYKVRA